jgi:hypothetical protein
MSGSTCSVDGCLVLAIAWAGFIVPALRESHAGNEALSAYYSEHYLRE